MTTGAFAILAVLSLLILVGSLLRIQRTKRRRRAYDPSMHPGGAPQGRAEMPPRAAAGSGFWTSPVWNVVGVIGGLIGTLTSIIGLFKP